MKQILWGALALIISTTPITLGQSNILNDVPGYTSNDILSGSLQPGSQFDLNGNNVVTFTTSGLSVFDVNTQALLNTVARPTAGQDTYLDGLDSFNVFSSFVTYAPSGSLAYVGFTNNGNTDDRIYEVNLTLDTWNHVADVSRNYDLEFYNGSAYAIGFDSGTNSLMQLDLGGTNNHDPLISLGGASAGFAFDSSGNLYYGTNNFPTQGISQLLQFSAADWMSGIGAGTYIPLAGDVISELDDLSSGGYDVAVDDADNVIFTQNGSVNEVAVWDGTTEPGEENYFVIAEGEGFITFVEATGDITDQTGSVLVSGFGDGFDGNGLAQTQIPEPSTTLLLLSGLGLILSTRRRK